MRHLRCVQQRLVFAGLRLKAHMDDAVPEDHEPVDIL
jgi:hypothetical protein